MVGSYPVSYPGGCSKLPMPDTQIEHAINYSSCPDLPYLSQNNPGKFHLCQPCRNKVISMFMTTCIIPS